MRFVLLIFSLLMLSSCGNSIQTQIESQQQQTKAQLTKLQQALDGNQLRNANILREYARILAEQQPELRTLVNQIATDSSSRGPLYQSLNQRLYDALGSAQSYSSPKEHLVELKHIFVAADLWAFNDALSDPINVLADLSNGQLPPVNALSGDVSGLANGAEDFGAGNQLIGNPAYGQWLTDSNGMSFWQWYGMYALLSNVMDVGFKRKRKRIYYDMWGRKRNYSYYHDYGRKFYSSPKQIRSQNAIEAATRKFANRNGFSSAYDKPRKGASRLSKVSKLSPSSGQNTFRTTSSKFKKSSFASSRKFRSKGFGFRRR
jgi:hypothetical protein